MRVHHRADKNRILKERPSTTPSSTVANVAEVKWAQRRASSSPDHPLVLARACSVVLFRPRSHRPWNGGAPDECCGSAWLPWDEGPRTNGQYQTRDERRSRW